MKNNHSSNAKENDKIFKKRFINIGRYNKANVGIKVPDNNPK
jgi:hypothetical protein